VTEFIKGVSLTQPWANSVGPYKKIETRSWSTKYRGPLVIHAAKGFPRSARDFAATERALGRVPERLPFGALVSVTSILDVRPTDELALTISGLERHLGDYSPGRWGWLLGETEKFDEPIGFKGSLGLFNIPLDLVRHALPESVIAELENMERQIGLSEK